MKFAINTGTEIYHKELPVINERENFDKFIDILEYNDERANVRKVRHMARNKLLELLVFVEYGMSTGVHCFDFQNSEDYLYACNTIARWSND